jgi:hypothetical protein
MGIWLTPEEEANARAEGLKLEQAKAEEPPGPPQVGPRTDRPAEIFDAKSGTQIYLEPEDAAAALQDGRAAALGGQQVNVVGPDGKVGAVPSEQLQRAMQAGYRLESQRENRAYNYVDRQGAGATVDVALGKALSEAAFGIPEKIWRATANEEQLARWEAELATHPGTATAATAAGFVGNMAAGGLGVFGAAEKAGAAAQKAAGGAGFLGGMARMGAEGAVIAAPEAITEAALGDPATAAEHLAWGLGSGVGLGAAVGAAKPALRALGKLAEGAAENLGVRIHADNPLKDLAEHQAFRSTMYGTDKNAYKLADQLPEGHRGLGRWTLDNGLLRNPGEKFEDYSLRVGEKKGQIGQEIGAVYKEMDANGAVGKSATELADKFTSDIIDPLKRQPMRQAEVGQLESLRDDFVQASRLRQLDRLEGGPAELQRMVEFKANPEKWGAANQELRTFVDKKIAAHTDDVKTPLYDLWEMRKDLDSRIWREKQSAKFGNLTPLEKELAKFRGHIDDAIREGSEGALGEGRSYVQEIDKLNKDYRHVSTLDEIAARSKQSEESRRNLSLSDMLSATSVGGGMLASGHFLTGGPVGLAAGLAHHYIRENGNVLVAKYANQLGTYFAHQAVLQGEREVEQLPSLLTRFAGGVKDVLPKPEIAALDGFRMLLGPLAGKDDERNARMAGDKIAMLATDPHRGAQIEAIVQHLGQGAPGVANAYAQHEAAKLQYLQQAAPQQQVPQPFSQPVKLTKQQIRDFKAKLEVAINPGSLFTHLQNGTLTPTHVEAARAVHPNVYKQMVDETKRWGLSEKAAKMPYQRVRRIEILIGEPISPASRQLADIQAIAASPTPVQQPPAPMSRPLKLPGSQLTRTQRLSTM